MSQLEINVKIIGFGFLRNFFNSDACKFNIAGYIIKNKQIPMGIEIPPICKELIAWLISGINWESAMPMMIQITTHIGRSFSK
jgi:hypothetical protein